MRCLVIDNSRAMRQVVVSALQQLGYEEVEAVASGAEALERLAAGPFDLVLTEWVMSEMSGPAMIEAIRALDPARRLPVLVVTAHATREQVIAAIKAGVDGYIVAPFTSDTLREKIDAATAAYTASGREPQKNSPVAAGL